MIRNAIAVTVGYIFWTLLWLGGNGYFFQEAADQAAAGVPLTNARTLTGLLVLSAVCSFVGGWATSLISRKIKVVWVLAGLLVITGIGVQASVWELMPVWYHLTFLILLFPLSLAGAYLVRADP